MKLRDDIVIAPTEVNEESVLVDASGKFKGMIKLNSSAAFIAGLFVNEISIEEAVKALKNEYEVDDEKAYESVNTLVNKLSEVGLFE